MMYFLLFFFSSRRRHTRLTCDWSSDVCSSDLLGRQGERENLERTGPGRGGFDLERLLFRRHDPFESGIARLVQSLVGGEQRRQRELHDLDAAFDLSLRRPLITGDLELGHGRHARQVEQLGHHRTDLMVVVVDRHLPEQDQVEPSTLELRSEGLRGFEAIRVETLGLEQDAAIGSHRERGADRLLCRRGAERDYDDVAAPGFLLEAQRRFDGELIVGIEDELYARFVERLAVGGDLHPRLGVRDALDAHGYSHKRRRHDATLYVASGESRFGERKANLRSLIRQPSCNVASWRRATSRSPC